jgi:hypothetical protein
VTAVAVASRSLAGRPEALRAALGRMQAATATQAPGDFRPNPAAAPTDGPPAAAAQPVGQPPAGTSDPGLNATLALLCSLQMQGASPGAPVAAPPALPR